MTDTKKPEPVVYNIFQALPKIIGDISPIAKDKKNQAQGYSFRGIDDVYAALNLLLAKYGVTILPEIVESKHEVAGQTKSGTSMYRHVIRMRYHFHAADGTKLTADSEGEGMDTGDKSIPKSFSTAFKAMAFQVFCIPTGEKVDTEDESPEVEAPKAAPKSKPDPHEAIEKKAITLIEGLEAGFATAEAKAQWQAAHRDEVNALPTEYKKTVAEAFARAAVRS